MILLVYNFLFCVLQCRRLMDKGNLNPNTDNFSLKIANLSLTKDFVLEHIETKSKNNHFKLSRWHDIKIGVYI